MAAASTALINLLIIISQLLALINIFFSLSVVSAPAQPLSLPIYHFGNSQLYVVRVSGQFPPVFVPLDTGNDVALFRCTNPTLKNIVSCSKYHNKTQCDLVNPTGCSPGCTFKREYNGTKVTAVLVQGDIALLPQIPMNNYTYGCIVSKTTPESFQGLLSLGRGPLSLLNQTYQLYRNVFSYCLPPYRVSTLNGFLQLGQSPPKRPQPPSTPLLLSRKRPTFYYASLQGIAANQMGLRIRRNDILFNAATGAGTVFDTGVMFTSLVRSAYDSVANEVQRLMMSKNKNHIRFRLNQFPTCYNVSINNIVQSITFVFSGGLNLTLPRPNFIIQIGRSYCLAITRAPSNGINSNLNVIGSFSQQNKQITINLTNATLSIRDMKRDCYY